MEKKINDLQIGVAGEHLVCADLIMRGYNAYLSDQGLPYDVVADIEGKLYKIQVKTTRKERPIPQRKKHTPAYLFHIKRCGKHGAKEYQLKDFDIMALVALDIKAVAYISKKQTRKTMHLNREKFLSLTFENIWKQN